MRRRGIWNSSPIRRNLRRRNQQHEQWNRMRTMSRLGRQFLRRAATAPNQTPALVALIAERFVPPFEALTWLDLPDDVRSIAPGRPLDAVVMDEFGVHCRRTRITAPPPGMQGCRIEFDMIMVTPLARLWFFVIDAEHAGE